MSLVAAIYLFSCFFFHWQKERKRNKNVHGSCCLSSNLWRTNANLTTCESDSVCLYLSVCRTSGVYIFTILLVTFYAFIMCSVAVYFAFIFFSQSLHHPLFRCCCCGNTFCIWYIFVCVFDGIFDFQQTLHIHAIEMIRRTDRQKKKKTDRSIDGVGEREDEKMRKKWHSSWLIMWTWFAYLISIPVKRFYTTLHIHKMKEKNVFFFSSFSF